MSLFPVSPQLALSFKEFSHSTFFRKGSSEILHPKDTEGNHPQRLPLANFELPSVRALTDARYLSSYA